MQPPESPHRKQITLKEAPANKLKLSPYHPYNCVLQMKYSLSPTRLLFTPPLDLLKGAYTNHFMGRWLLALYNTTVVIVISLKSPMHSHCTHSDCLMSDNIIIMSMIYVIRCRNGCKAPVNWLLQAYAWSLLEYGISAAPFSHGQKE